MNNSSFTLCICKWGDEGFDFVDVELVHEFLHHVLLAFLIDDSDVHIRNRAVEPETQEQILREKVRIPYVSSSVNLI